MAPWKIKGRELASCTCEGGCECRLGGRLNRGCQAVVGVNIDEGHFGEARLDGLRAVGVYRWPGPIHEGNGEAMAFIDSRADAAQRDGLLRILSGQETKPFATVFSVFAATVSKVHDAVFTDPQLDLDSPWAGERVAIPAQAGMRNGALERLLERDLAVTAGGLVLLAVLAWLYLLTGVGVGASAWDRTALTLFPHEAAGLMDGMDMPVAAWGAGTWVLAAAMWWTMMVAMMTPSVAPAILLYARVHRHAAAQGTGGLAPTAAFAAGYLSIWLGFALLATGLQWGAQQLGLVSPDAMGSQSRWFSAAVLIATGLYELAPLKQACLNHCRSLAPYLSRYWRPGASGALALGLRHGAFCLGCCWMLMALLFVGGVMNLAWIAALTTLVLLEKLAPGPWVAKASGALLIAWGVATLLV